MVELNTIYLGNSLDILKTIPDNYVNLVVTSPPYADKRKKQYDTISEEKYVDWFLNIADEIKRVLKPTGSFILNIKEGAKDGEKQLYVLDLIIAMKRRRQWRYVEDYIWHKKNAYPGKWATRFRDSWEHCIHFTKEKKFDMYQDSVMVPAAQVSKDRLNRLNKNDYTHYDCANGSGLGAKRINWIGRDFAYPTNVLYMATESSNVGHSAAYPVSLPSWFIKLFTKENDIVLDPFMGSGTTALACMKLNRNYIGIEKEQKHLDVAKGRIDKWKLTIQK